MDTVKTFSRGRLVTCSPVADHCLSKLTLGFVPKVGETYHLYYKVGDRNNEHELMVCDLRVKVIFIPSEIGTPTPTCLASLQSKDDELNEVRKKLQEQSERAHSAEVELVNAQLKIKQLQFNMEVERKDAILAAERSAATLFEEESTQRMMEKLEIMLNQLTKLATARIRCRLSGRIKARHRVPEKRTPQPRDEDVVLALDDSTFSPLTV